MTEAVWIVGEGALSKRIHQQGHLQERPICITSSLLIVRHLLMWPHRQIWGEKEGDEGGREQRLREVLAEPRRPISEGMEGEPEARRTAAVLVAVVGRERD